MLTGPLPTRLDHNQMASQARLLKGEVPISQLQRFGAMLADVDGNIDLELSFSKGKHGRTLILGRARVAVGLICQNCMQLFRESLDCGINLQVVSSDKENDFFEDDTDTIVCENMEISLADLIEDELIMSLPMIPRHNENGCHDNEYRQGDSEIVVDEVNKTHRPFAGLAAALKKQDNQEN